MYSKEEAKQIKKEFWTNFGFFSQRKRIALGLNKKWLGHQTGISCLSLKFDFDHKQSFVGIEINSSNISESEKYYERLKSLEKQLNNKFEEPPLWNPNFQLPEGKSIIKIYHELNSVNVFNKECWPQVFKFFFDHMLIYEEFYIEFEDFIKDQNW